MATVQDWCLECGAGAPGKLSARPGWRSAMTLIAATVVLATAAVAASYAALSKSPKKTVTRPAAVAKVVAPATIPTAP